jgi:hypothetical protein
MNNNTKRCEHIAISTGFHEDVCYYCGMPMPNPDRPPEPAEPSDCLTEQAKAFWEEGYDYDCPWITAAEFARQAKAEALRKEEHDR